MKKKNSFVIGVVVLTALSGAAGGLYATGMLEPVLKRQAAEVTAAVTNNQRHFVTLDPLTVPVVGDRRLRSGVLLRVTLEMADAGAGNDVKRILPRLNDAILREFYARPVGKPEGSEFIDIERVTERIRRIVDGIVGEGRVLNVLLENAVRMS